MATNQTEDMRKLVDRIRFGQDIQNENIDKLLDMMGQGEHQNIGGGNMNRNQNQNQDEDNNENEEESGGDEERMPHGQGRVKNPNDARLKENRSKTSVKESQA